MTISNYHVYDIKICIAPGKLASSFQMKSASKLDVMYIKEKLYEILNLLHIHAISVMFKPNPCSWTDTLKSVSEVHI